MPTFFQKHTDESTIVGDQPKVEKNTFEQRKIESDKIRAKYPNRVPCMVERSSSAKNLPVIDKKKFLVPNHMTFGQFVHVIRRRIKLNPEQAIFLYVDNILPPATKTMELIDVEHKNEDGFVYCTYAKETSFGDTVDTVE